MGEEGTTQRPMGFDPTRSMELVQQYQHGDAAAADELLRRYRPRMVRIVRVMVGPSRRALLDPEDIVQETMIVAARRLGEVEARTPDAILCWLRRIAELQLKGQLQYLHAQKRDPKREHSLDASPGGDERAGLALPSCDPTPSQVFAREEMEHIVDREIHLLEPADYREVILLRDLCGAEWEHIRSVLGRPSLAAVQDLHRRAHERLRERLARFQS